MVALTAAAGDVPLAERWDRFRGPNGTGVAPSQAIPTSWKERDIAWKTAIPGAGTGSPVAWGDAVFVQSASTDGKERTLLRLDARSGKIVWTARFPGQPAKIHRKNSLASSTPATDGERVYATFWDSTHLHLAAFDFAGKLLWQRNLGPHTSQHGAGHSPVVFEGRVFVSNDDDHVSKLQAFDAKSGEPLWEAARQAYRSCYTTPFIHHGDGRQPELIAATTAGIGGFNPASGVKNWWWDWAHDKTPLRTVNSPVIVDELVIASGGDGGGARHTVAVRINGTASSNPLVWESKRGVPYVPCFVASGKHLYFVNDQGIAGCMEAATGKTLWTERLGRAGVTGSPIRCGDVVLVVNEDGESYSFAAESTRFRLLGQGSIGEPVLSTPALAGGRLFVRGNTHVFCITAPTTVGGR